MTVQIASRIQRIKPSPSSTAAQIARDLKAQGRDIISLTTGEPDFDTPEHICRAAAEAMDRGETRYTTTDGTPALKRAVQAKFSKENGLDYELDEIVVSSGGKHVVFNALMATLEEGDEVIVPAPYWVSYPDIALLAGARPVVVQCPETTGFKMTPEALADAITPKTRWLVLNSPSNPSGAAYTADELMALASVLVEHSQVAVLSDDIYEHILFDGRSHATIAKVAPELAGRTLTLNGVSKAYAMTGWRIGFAGGPKPLMRAMSKLQSQSTSNPSSISQAAAVAALEGPQDLVRERANAFERRRGIVLKLLNAIDGLHCAKPEGAFYVYPNCSGLIGRTRPDTGARLTSDDDVVRYLLERAEVATIAGSAYGLSPHFRISIASDEETLRAACLRIANACAQLQ
jgi:aspartate aminotransferase